MANAYFAEKTVTLVAIECGNCGVIFGMGEEYQKQRRADHKGWYCPNGCCRAYNGPSEADRLRDELARATAQLDQEKARVQSLRSDISTQHTLIRRQSASINGYKGVVARTKRRAMDGRCPCCSEQFKNLKAHMRARHPGFDPEKGAQALAEKAP